jgi:DeoR family transcriptional regulator, suf operon transcriptional repressor
MMLDPRHVDSSPRAEVLRYVQRQGSASIKDLEGALGVTTTAVREQVAHLLHEGFLQATRVRGEIGRPYYVYSLTARAQDLFPKDYAALAVLLLEEVMAEHGTDGLRLILNRVSRRLADKFAGQAQGPELAQKLLGLVAALGDAGMEISMVPVASEGEQEDGYVLKTHTCPYFDIARSHREVCEMEQEMMGELLGPGVDIKLGNCIIDGKHACEFHVSRVAIQPKEKAVKVTSVGVPE